MNVKLDITLINFYVKCGDMSKAMEVFWGMEEKNVYTWSSMLNGLVKNGFGEKCLELFSLIKQEGVSPNAVTFMSILRTCSVEPELERYVCLVDLYGRAGCLDEAFSVIQGMHMKPHAAVRAALLNACRMHKSTEMANLASSKLLESNN